MKSSSFLILAASAALALGGCNQHRPQLTAEQVKSVVGLSMGQVDAKLGHASSTTNAGKGSEWWEYIGVTMPNGMQDGSCHIIFQQGVATEVRC